MEGETIFNIAGVPNEEFLEEVTDSQQVKKNAIFFALLTDGVPGDPGFGVGLSVLVGESDTEATAIELDRRSADMLPALVEGIRYEGVGVERFLSEQLMTADLRFTDLDSNARVLVPLTLSGT
jgi:hypothetical protein